MIALHLWYFKPKIREREREVPPWSSFCWRAARSKGSGLEGAVKLIFMTSCQRQKRASVDGAYGVRTNFIFGLLPTVVLLQAQATSNDTEHHRHDDALGCQTKNNSREAIPCRSTQRETAKIKSKLLVASYRPCNLLASISISIPRCDGQYHEGFLDFICRIDRHFLRKHDCCWQFNS